MQEEFSPDITCIVGIGNPLRSDDAVGPYVAARIEALKLKNVRTIIVQQQNIELLDEFLNYKKVILVDAFAGECPAGQEVNYYQVVESENRALSSSHHLDAQLLIGLARKLYGKQSNIYVCSIKAESFDFAEQLSETVKQRADQAVKLICSSIFPG